MGILRAGVYVRVSTTDQNTDAQETELLEYAQARKWDVKLYRDRGQSGANEHRPALEALMADVRKKRIDVVAVWSLDRLARSLRQLLTIADEFRHLDIDLVSMKQNIDTGSPSGRFTYSILAAVSELERELIRERVKAGMMHARRKGKHIGRPPLRRFTEKEIANIRAAKKIGMSIRGLARRNGTTQYVIERITGDTTQ